METQDPLRIVVADNDRDSADTLSALLQTVGHEVHTGYDGVDALELCCSCSPDVMVLDIAMPNLDGNRVAREIRRMEEREDTLLIALSGYADEEHRLASMEAGFDYYVAKPAKLLTLTSLFAKRQSTAGDDCRRRRAVSPPRCQDEVRGKYPRAIAVSYGTISQSKGQWVILAGPETWCAEIGKGATKEEAWADAVAKLKP